MATTHTTPFSELLELAHPIQPLEVDWYSADDTILQHQRANVQMLADVFGKIDIAGHPELYNNEQILTTCAEEHGEWFAEYQLCRKRWGSIRPPVEGRIISQVTDLVEQLSNLQLCYNMVVGESRQMLEALCPEAVEEFDECFESGC